MFIFTTSFSVLAMITLFPPIVRAWLYREGWRRAGRCLYDISIHNKNAEERVALCLSKVLDLDGEWKEGLGSSVWERDNKRL